LTEFIGLDIEMAINEHYYEVLDVAEALFAYMFGKLAACPELKVIAEQHPFEPFVYQASDEVIDRLGVGIIAEGKEPTDEFQARIHNRHSRVIRMPLAMGVRLLNSKSEKKIPEDEDIDTESEKKIGVLMKERYGVDFYIFDRYPWSARPFYTMPCAHDPNFTNSYDMFMRGEEISSGAQRIHDAEMLKANAEKKKVDVSLISDYVDSFRLGAWPHGGFGVGLERVTMLYLGLKNIRFASLFPRDPQRILP
jgi:aspartyl-tRNA synthetase